ncbi:hypothetical protein VTJ04DRAFT_7618 [Mycothermus thermophilus]|uniref:uncharacterized protein n=1 Tax=Humicola insolens TaxID=85995 RepID=UPI0037449192
MADPADDASTIDIWESASTQSERSGGTWVTLSESSRSLTPPELRLRLSSPTGNSSELTLVDIPPPEVIISPAAHRGLVSTNMNKDGCFTYIHLHHSHHADLLEDFCKDRLPQDDVYVPPDLQPINPEEEDDVVPDQHAAYGVQKATQKTREPAWRDLGLSELMAKGPAASTTAGTGRRTGAAGRKRGGGYKGLPR